MTQPGVALAFHGNAAIKAEYIARLREKLIADDRKLEMWHDLASLGIPRWLICVGDYYNRNISSTWSIRFLQAARVGADLDVIKGPFLVFVLRSTREKVISRYAAVLAAMDRSIGLWERSDIHSPNWLNEASAAEAAGWAAAAEADARPPWNAARTAVHAAMAATRPQAVAETVNEASRTSYRAGYDPHGDGIADELLRLMGTR